MSQKFIKQEMRSAPQVDALGRKFVYSQLWVSDFVIAPGDTFEAIDDYGEGTLESYQVHLDSRHQQISVELYTDGGTKYSVQLFNPQNLLRYGWGLTPGDVALIGGISPDRHGTPNGVHPWLSRYKDTGESDYTNQTGRWYSVCYTPNNPPEYTHRIRFAIKNPRTDDVKLRELVVNRRVYIQTQNTPE